MIQTILIRAIVTVMYSNYEKNIRIRNLKKENKRLEEEIEELGQMYDELSPW